MPDHQVVSREEWLAARVKPLAEEKEFARRRDTLTIHCRELPWVGIRDYCSTAQRKVRLSDLFRGKSQLIIYHFMFHPTGTRCKSCRSGPKPYERVVAHLRARDTPLATRGSTLCQIEAFRSAWAGPSNSFMRRRRRSSIHDFGYLWDDRGKATTPTSAPPLHHRGYSPSAFSGPGWQPLSLFDLARPRHINGAYHYLDIVPKAATARRSYHMDWVRLRDEVQPRPGAAAEVTRRRGGSAIWKGHEQHRPRAGARFSV
jgi:predicted dithiol-disulfide oxidoreductase (DUF899 family)